MTGFIVVMNDGIAYDGVYLYKDDAESMADHYREVAPGDDFTVMSAPNGFSMRHHERIFWFLRSE